MFMTALLYVNAYLQNSDILRIKCDRSHKSKQQDFLKNVLNYININHTLKGIFELKVVLFSILIYNLNFKNDQKLQSP